MILTEVGDYLRRHRRASVQDLARGLGAAPEAVKGMLAALERKGRVRRLPVGKACCSCCKCDPDVLELYEWIGESPKETAHALDSDDRKAVRTGLEHLTLESHRCRDARCQTRP